MITMDVSPTILQRKRIIDQNTLLKQQIIEHMKRSVLVSRIILQEDFDMLMDTPLIFLPHVVRNYRPILSTIISTLVFVVVTKCSKSFQWRYSALAGLPVGFELCSIATHCWKKQRCLKQIDKFIELLEQQAILNRKVLKQMRIRMNTMEELENKINAVAFSVIQADDEQFANFICKTLEALCQSLQEQLLIQSVYSEGHHSYLGCWKFENNQENDSLVQIAAHFEKLSEFYILLASNMMSSTTFSLEAALWRSDADFRTVFHTIKDTISLLGPSITGIETQMKQLDNVFYDYNKENYTPSRNQSTLASKPSKDNFNSTIYSESLDDCKNRLRIAFNLAKTIDMQSASARCIFLKGMLENFNVATTLVKNLLRYEKSLLDPEHGVNDNCEQVEICVKSEKLVVNHKEADIGSDDEEFQYSPHESDDEFERECRNHVNVDFDHSERQSLVVQGLMLQELRNRMKDVRRIKISRTPAGDLIVQERPMTLQESGGQNQTSLPPRMKDLPNVTEKSLSENTFAMQFDMIDGNRVPPVLPLPPPSLPPALTTSKSKFDISLNEMSHSYDIQSSGNASFLASISSIARQRSHNEDIFGCNGDDYVASGESSSGDD